MVKMFGKEKSSGKIQLNKWETAHSIMACRCLRASYYGAASAGLGDGELSFAVQSAHYGRYVCRNGRNRAWINTFPSIQAYTLPQLGGWQVVAKLYHGAAR
jgi:hypothetical protein